MSTEHVATSRSDADVESANAELLQARARAELAESVGHGLTGSLNVRRTALRLLSMIKPVLADWGLVVMPDSRTGGLLLVGGNEAAFHEVISRASVEGSGLGRVLSTGRPELLHVALDMPEVDGLASMVPHPVLTGQAAALRPADVLGVALTARGTIVGALVAVRGQGRGFDEADVEFAQRIAERAALALDSARMYEERALMATTLEQSLRPPALPDLDGARLAARYRPAAEQMDIGGDFYDVHGASGDWLLSLGDVCGKGVGAAALTGRTRQSIRTAAHFDRRPDVLLSALNTVLIDGGIQEFVTVACARLRVGADAIGVDLAVAGHPAPLVLRADGGVEQVEAYGAAIGMVPGAEYRSVAVELRTGDTLLMFTDGVDEALGRDGRYGVDRLIALLPPYAGAAPDVVCDAVEQNVVEYLDGRPHDDIALLAVTCGA